MADRNNHMSAADLWELVNTGTIKADAGNDKGVIGKNGATDIIKSDNVKVKTVRANVSCSDLIINNHKMNSYLYEITNMKKLQNTAIGNFTVMGTVLVKVYDFNLEKYVLIRRQVRVPMFSNVLDPYAIDERLDIPDAKDTIYNYKINKDDGDE